MRNAYLEVLDTYFRRALSSVGSVCFLVGGLGALIGATGMHTHAFADAVPGPMTGLLMGESFLGAMLWIHFRELIVNPNRRLSPGSTAPIVTIFAILSLILVIAWPAMLMPTFAGSLALVAVVIAWFALLGWWVLTISWALNGVLVIIYWGFFFTTGNRILQLGERPALAVGILVGGVLAIRLAVIRMIRLTEEDALFNRRLQFSTWSLRPRMTGEVNRVWAEGQKSRLFGWPSKSARIFIPTKDTLWERSRRWRVLNSGSLRFVPVLFGFMTAVVLWPWWFSSPARTSPPNAMSPPWGFLWFYLTFLPPLAIAQAWLNQWRFLEMELLRPISRPAFLKEIGLAMAINLAQLWAMFVAIIIIELAWVAPKMVDAKILATAIATSALFQIFAFGLAVWFIRYRSPLFTAATIMLSVALGLIIMVFPWLAIPSGIVLAIIGVFLIRQSYRKWLVTELG